MARSPNPVSDARQLSELKMSREEAKSKLLERIAKAAYIAQCIASGIFGEYDKWDAYNRDLLLSMFNAPQLSYEYSNTGSIGLRLGPGSAQSPSSEYRSRLSGKKRCLESILERLELFSEPSAPPTPEPQLDARAPLTSTRKIFVVHGHDSAALESVARFLERIGFTPIILHEQPNKGRTVIEKFEEQSDVGFAVVLLTPDDLGKANDGEELAARARQNVVLELGYFVGHLGRDRVCTLKKGKLDLPSDILGVVWTEMDAPGAWHMALGKELQAAGYAVDWNKVMGPSGN